MLSHCKAQKKNTKKCGYRHVRKISELFKKCCPAIDFSSCNNFANLDYFAKVFVPVQSGDVVIN